MGNLLTLVAKLRLYPKEIQDLLSKIFIECQKHSKVIDAKKFRAHNYEYLETLDQMEDGLYLENIRD